MTRALCLIGSSIGATCGWLLGERGGLMCALMISVAGSGLGYVAVQAVLRRFVD